MPNDGWDDDVLLAMALCQALQAQSQVPSELVDAVKNQYTWHTVDAELAELIFDSTLEPEGVACTRSESASIRALTFTSARLTIDVEVTENSLIGQVMPPGEGTMEALTRDGATTTAPVDEVGCFLIEPIPPGPFRLRCRNQGTDVVTGWITLSSGDA